MDMIIRDCDYVETGIDWLYCKDCSAITQFLSLHRSNFNSATAWRNGELLGLRGTVYTNLSDFYQIVEAYK